MATIDATKLLTALQGANAYFHLHKEDDKKFRNKFYTIKDAIVKLMLTKGDKFGINYSIEGSMIDGGETRYILVYFTATNIGVFIHVPIKVYQDILDCPTEYDPYKPKKDGYVELDISKEQFNKDYTYLENVYKNIISNKI